MVVQLHAQVVVTNDSVFNTMDQMLLANELFESGEPFAEFLGYNLDDLDPMVLNTPDSVAYTTGIENYEYSRYLLGTVISRSGLGLHMMWSPVIEKMAAMEPAGFDGSYTGGMINGYNEDDELMKTIHHFSMLAHQMAPANPFPQFAEFASGNTHLPQTVASDFQMDFGTLRWDRSRMTKILSPGAMGQTMLKQYFWAQDMLGAFHDSLDNEIPATGENSPDSTGSPKFDPSNNIYYGGNNLDGFIGQVLTAEAINKTLFLINKLAYDGQKLGAVDPATYDPAQGILYFPHGIAVTETSMGTMLPPMLDTLTVSDPKSRLFDQLSFLWATLSFKNMMDPDYNDESHLAYHEVFDGDPFPAPMSVTGVAGPFDLMKGTSKVIFLNTVMMHYNMAEGTFVDDARLSSGGGVVMGDTISAVNAGYSLVVLAKMAEEFTGTPLETKANDLLAAQTAFILNKLTNASGGYYNGYVTGSGAVAGPLTLESLGSLIRGLYASYGATGDNATLEAADTAWVYLTNNFYLPDSKIFRTVIADDNILYTPFRLAVLSGALREATIVGGHREAATLYTRTFKAVYNKMFLAEAEQTGETGGDSDGDGISYVAGGTRPFVFAAEAEYTITTGVGDNPVDIAGIALYPNPATEIINYEFGIDNSADIEVKIFDITGQMVFSKPDNVGPGRQKVVVNISTLNPGIYFVRLIVNHQVADAKKLIVTH